MPKKSNIEKIRSIPQDKPKSSLRKIQKYNKKFDI